MERRDYLMTQIQQLGRVIKLLIEKLQGKSSSLNSDEDVLRMREEFRENCGFDMDLLSTPYFEELKATLLTNNNYNTANIELLAGYMALLAERSEGSPLSLIHRLKVNALQLYELIETSEKTYSVERQEKMSELRKSIS